MHKQFFGKETWMWLLCGVVLYGIAPLAWWQPLIAFIGIILAGSVVYYLTYRNVVTGIALVLFELVIGGHGLLLHTDISIGILTLRHAIFIGFFSAYFVRFLLKKERLRFGRIHITIGLFLLWLLIGFLVGGVQNGWGVSFDELNSYFYLTFLIPVLSRDWIGTEKRQILIAVFSGITFLALITLLFAFSYNHLPGKFMHIPYTVYRDARVTEVSLQVIQASPAGVVQHLMRPWLGLFPYWYRIFNTSHVYLFVGLCFYIAYALMHGLDRSVRRSWWSWVSLVGSAVAVSMSRSILLGLAVAIIVSGLSLLILGKLQVRRWHEWLFGLCVAGCGAILVFVMMATFPVPHRPDLREAIFYETSANTTRQAAVISRWTLLHELVLEIKKAPIFGYGFGKSLTYQSSDPRILSTSNGTYTTYRFEWGYFDLWLKLGVIGVMLYAYMLWRLFGERITKIRGNSWLNWGALMSVLGLCVIHIFTPYLNHPLGIGVIILATIILYDNRTEGYASTYNQKGNVIMTFPSVIPVSVSLEDR